MKLGTYVLLGSLALTSMSGISHAASIFNGLRGPTNWQVDTRINYSNREGTETLRYDINPRYWNDHGWVFAGVKYDDGIEGISIGAGPIYRVGNNIKGFLYGTLRIPTDDSNGYEGQINLLGTYLSSDGKFEVDWSSTFDPSDQVSVGLVAGGRIMDKIRATTGVTTVFNGKGDFSPSLRINSRYTVSSRLHLEGIVDRGENSGVSLIGRYNF